MKLTRRGWIVVGVATAAIVSGMLFGARALNAIAAPTIVAVLGAAVQVYRFDRPTIDREVPAHGTRGETLPVGLMIETSTPFSARLRDMIGDDLAATGNEREATIGRTTFEYRLHLGGRGVHTVGPLDIVARDVLGLVATSYHFADRREVLVRPRVHTLAGPRRDDLLWLHGGDDRGQFDQLRRYQRGDPLRDIHWKSSAKQPEDDLVVKQFAAHEENHTVWIGAEGNEGCGDAMAEAAASIAVHLLSEGVRVGLETPEGRLDPQDGADGRDAILDHLARTSTGSLAEADRARIDVLVTASEGDTRVTMGHLDCAFVELSGTDLHALDGVPEGRLSERPAEVIA